MRLADALNLTMRKFDLQARDLAVRSGIGESALSKFRKGERDLQARNIERVLTALSDEAYHYLLTQLALDRSSPQQMIQLLSSLADRIEAGEVKFKKTEDLLSIS
jgi:transcriptional regulator with XRE-family HTH domain